MNELELRNVLLYGIIAVLNTLLGLVAVMMAAGALYGFREGEPLASIAKEMAGILTLVAAGLASWLAANRPRIGSATLAANVDAARADGVSRSEMTVLTPDYLTTTLADRVTALDPVQRDRLVRILENRSRRAKPAAPAAPTEVNGG